MFTNPFPTFVVVSVIGAIWFPAWLLAILSADAAVLVTIYWLLRDRTEDE